MTDSLNMTTNIHRHTHRLRVCVLSVSNTASSFRPQTTSQVSLSLSDFGGFLVHGVPEMTHEVRDVTEVPEIRGPLLSCVIKGVGVVVVVC